MSKKAKWKSNFAEKEKKKLTKNQTKEKIPASANEEPTFHFFFLQSTRTTVLHAVRREKEKKKVLLQKPSSALHSIPLFAPQ